MFYQSTPSYGKGYGPTISIVPGAPSAYVPAPVNVDEHPHVLPPEPDSNISDPMSSQPADLTTIESSRIPSTWPDPPAPHALREGIDVTVPSPPNAFTVPSPYFSPHWTPWDVPDIPPSPPTAAALYNMPVLPAGLPWSPDSPLSESPVIPSPPSPRSISVLDPGATAQGEGSTHDALDLSVNRQNIMPVTAPDFSPSQFSSPVAGVAIAGPSRSSRALDV
ncbi:hypothetical protein EDB86DRAFT_2264338 [Lactarius hatsudake]|nr:hypothetical protein EDB86DRAFT_2264338 [Lactarius hatsudake]